MTYLLDVNALVALGFAQHQFHPRVAHWLRKENPFQLATCSITELGFIRVLVQTPAYGFTVAHARELLLRIKDAGSFRFTFISDDHDSSQLPEWVKTARQITDGHLVTLAEAHGGLLATLDRGVVGAYVIPER